VVVIEDGDGVIAKSRLERRETAREGVVDAQFEDLRVLGVNGELSGEKGSGREGKGG